MPPKVDFSNQNFTPRNVWLNQFRFVSYLTTVLHADEATSLGIWWEFVNSAPPSCRRFAPSDGQVEILTEVGPKRERVQYQ